jgi:succinate dehydrogenase/fumarate reductase cytochrome b subunit
MGNHIVGLRGQDSHIAYMAAARHFYRRAWVEPVLLLLFVWQIASGLRMVARSWSARHGGIAWLQALSGVYLSLFLCVHIVAVLSGRALLGLDTDFRFAAAGFHVPPWQWFFAPYYFLAVFSLFAHLGCAVFWNITDLWAQARVAALGVFLATGLILGTLIDLALAGKVFPVDIPQSYRATYSGVQSK